MEFHFSKQSFKINGKTYSSPDQMPEDVRKVYESAMAKLREDKDGNGVPDVLEGKFSGDGTSLPHVQAVTRYTVNGVTYNSFEEMPPNVREFFQTTRAALGQFRAMTNDEPERTQRRSITLTPWMAFLWVLLIVMVVLLVVLVVHSR